MTKKSFMKGKKGQFDSQSSINVIQHYNRINNGMGLSIEGEKALDSKLYYDKIILGVE